MTVSTAYPDAHPESTSMDGYTAESSGTQIWDDIHAGAGSSSFAEAEKFDIIVRTSTTTNQYFSIFRLMFLFDTSSIGDTDTIDSATMGFVSNLKLDQFDEPGAVSLVATTPASNTAIENSDHVDYGTTKLATDITVANVTADGSTYTTFTLNSTGLDAISTTGITKLGLRESNFDIADTEPTWTSNKRVSVDINSAEEIVTGDKRPKLTITHTTPPPFTPKAMMF